MTPGAKVGIDASGDGVEAGAVAPGPSLAAVIDVFPDGLAVVNGEGLVTRWNATAERLTGRGSAEVVGRPFPFALPAPGTPHEQAVGDRWIELTSAGLEDQLVVAIHDITRQKALEAAQTVFVAATSHELKTPLTVVRSFADWLETHGEDADPERLRQAYHAIASSAEELRRIVDKILLTARTEAGAVDLSRERLELGQLLVAVTDQLGPAIRDHRLHLDVPPDLPAVWADRQAVRTIVGQLLENAIKYSPDGGAITVAARRAPAPAEVPWNPPEVEVTVADEGIGLAPGDLDYVFTAFYQGETRERSGVRGGVGLGLAIVRRLVEAHGGRVRAAGEPGGGAQFSFTLPVLVGEADGGDAADPG